MTSLGNRRTAGLFRIIVAAVDFSDSADDALDAALALASTPDHQLHLLHVVPDPVPALWTDELPQVDLRAVEETWKRGGLDQLAALVARRRLDPLAVTTAVAVGSPAQQILRYAEDHGADVVVLGSHGHGLVRRFLLGNVADKVVRQAQCAVLVVPHHTLRNEPANPPATATAVLPS
jgi:nucleotide-binding universal stress UspA family protein